MKKRSLRSWLYWSARRLGDVEAVERGPGAVVKRQARKVTYRKVNRSTARTLRKFGL